MITVDKCWLEDHDLVGILQVDGDRVEHFLQNNHFVIAGFPNPVFGGSDRAMGGQLATTNEIAFLKSAVRVSNLGGPSGSKVFEKQWRPWQDGSNSL